MTLRIFLVRHGETEWNKARLFQGHTDIPLATSGAEQAKITGRFIRGRAPALAFTSPLVRTQQTVEQFAIGAEPSIVADLKEQNLGVWEGRSLADVATENPELFYQWRYENYAPDGAESQEQVRDRMLRALTRIVSELREVEPAICSETGVALRTAVVVSHGAALRMLLEKMNIIERAHMVALLPASVSCIDIDDDASTAEEIIATAKLRLLNLSPDFLADFTATAR